ncbi:MAG: hypothetical protein AB8B96_12145 [Lysobacterales bacterium]
MFRLLAAGWLTMTFCGSAMAGTLMPVNTDFSTLPSNFQLADFATENATAVLSIDDVAGSMGLVFRGTWTVVEGGVEDAIGIYRPQLLDTSELIFAPADNDGIVSVGFTLDAQLADPTGTNVTRLFAQLVVYQQLPSGFIRGYTQLRRPVVIMPGPSTGYVVEGLVPADFDDGNGNQPDFGPDARPLAFGLQLGGRIATPANAPGSYMGGVDADNWTVTIDNGVSIFSDSFE